MKSLLVSVFILFATSLGHAESCQTLKNQLSQLAKQRPSSWPAENDGYNYKHVPGRWSESKVALQQISAAELHESLENTTHDWGASDGLKNADDDEFEGVDCSQLINESFSVGKDIVAFTLARAPEQCSEAPKAVWVSNGKILFKSARLMPLYNMNVHRLWCVGDFAVFGLEAYYEGGGQSDELVLWHYPTGKWFSFQISGKKFSDLLPNWYQAKVAVIGKSVFLQTSKRTLRIDAFDSTWKLSK